MLVPLFAMRPPDFAEALLIGFLLVLLTAGLFVRVKRNRGKMSEKDRRAGLGCLSILIGPFIGVFLAWLANSLGFVHPADVEYIYSVFATLGVFAGMIAGAAFSITGLFCPRDSTGKVVPAKPTGLTDEL